MTIDSRQHAKCPVGLAKHTKIIVKLVFAIYGVLQWSGRSFASEGAVYGGPTGGTDIRNAYVSLTPGFSAGFAEVPGWTTEYLDSTGKSSKALRRFDLVYNINAFALAYTYPFKLLGGTLSSTLQASNYDYVRFSANNRTERVSGWGDLYADLIKYTYYFGQTGRSPSDDRLLPYGLTVQGSYSMIFPIGTYNTHDPTTSGHNDYFVIPNAAATYLTSPNFLGDGTEISVRLFYDHALENPLTQYHSGDVLDLDWAVSERRGRWQYGLAGFTANQMGPDRLHGDVVSLDGKYFRITKIGPVLAYDFPKLGLTLKGKATLPLGGTNAISGPLVVISAGLRF